MSQVMTDEELAEAQAFVDACEGSGQVRGLTHIVDIARMLGKALDTISFYKFGRELDEISVKSTVELANDVYASAWKDIVRQRLDRGVGMGQAIVDADMFIDALRKRGVETWRVYKTADVTGLGCEPSDAAFQVPQRTRVGERTCDFIDTCGTVPTPADESSDAETHVDMQALFVVTELHGGLFGEPQLLAIGHDLTQRVVNYSAPENAQMPCTWTDDDGDGVTSHFYWQSAATKLT